MRILLVHNYYINRGGEDVVFEQEMDLLKRHGHCVQEYRRSNEECAHAGKAALVKEAIWSGKSKKELSEKIKSFKPDVVHFHNIFFVISPSTYYACKEAGVPVVQTLHNYRLFCPKAIFFRDGHPCEDCKNKFFPWPGILHACYHRSRMQTAVIAGMLAFSRVLNIWSSRIDAYISLTNFSRNKFIECGIPQEKIHIKSNFVASDPGAREGSGEYALFVGRLSLEKGIKTVIEAWRGLKDIPLKIAGAGELFDQLNREVSASGLKQIQFLGEQSHGKILSLIKGASFLVFGSEWYECFPLVIIEAFACGVPVITSKLGVMPEIVNDGVTGLFFEPGNPTELSARVQWLWNHREEAERMGKNARNEYENRYSAEKNYSILVQLYNQVLMSPVTEKKHE